MMAAKVIRKIKIATWTRFFFTTPYRRRELDMLDELDRLDRLDGRDRLEKLEKLKKVIAYYIKFNRIMTKLMRAMK
jgi:hypothetical protein